MSKTYTFSGKEPIADILLVLPEAADILFSHGLGCVGCQLNATETLADGVLGHGFSDTDLGRILADLNEAAEDMHLQADCFSSLS